MRKTTTFESGVGRASVSARLLARGCLADGLLDERRAARSTAVLSWHDHRSSSLLDAGAAAAHAAARPAAPPAQNTVHRSCRRQTMHSELCAHVKAKITQKNGGSQEPME